MMPAPEIPRKSLNHYRLKEGDMRIRFLSAMALTILCGATVTHAARRTRTYYLALGDSLAIGLQTVRKR